MKIPWINKSTKKQASDLPERPPSPPENIRLPLNRPPLLFGSTAADATSESLFFTKLPPELRTKIYRHAFGDRTFHMDLRFSRPPCRNTDGRYHAAIDYMENMKHAARTQGPQEWRWWGSVCHRDAYREWWADSCQEGKGICCVMPGVPEICYMGAMGWLRSCRQAYIEAIDILYSNTFFISSNALLRLFPQLIPAKHLACITGLMLDLELMLYDDKIIGTPHDRTDGWTAFTTILSLLGSETFKNLRELDISYVDPAPKRNPMTRKEKRKVEQVLQMFDQLLLNFGPRFRRLQVFLTWPLFSVARDDAQKHHKGFVQEHIPPRTTRFWRPVNPGHDGSDPSQALGYWVVAGKNGIGIR